MPVISELSTEKMTLYVVETADMAAAFRLAVEMLDAIAQGKSYDSAEYMANLEKIRYGSTLANTLANDIEHAHKTRRALINR